MMLGAMRAVLLVVVLGWYVTGCGSPPAVGEVLSTRLDGLDADSGALARADEEVHLAQAWAEAEPKNPQAQAAASWALAVAADLRLLIDQVGRAQAGDLEIEDLVGLDDSADSDLKSAALGLCSAGLDFGKAATALDEEHPLGAYYRAFHLSLVAWAEGAPTALLRGRGPALKDLLVKNADRFPTLHGAAPLRLRGRFLDRAPWPYGDKEEGLLLLREAVRLAPVPVNWQFLGDSLWSCGDVEGAAAAWRSGTQAPAQPATAYGAGLRRALNQARLDALTSSATDRP